MENICKPASCLIQETIKENPIYEVFSGVSFLNEVAVRRALWRGKPSKRSIMFKDDIKDVFNISSPSFDTYYQQAVSGKGNEITRIKTLHSSALLSLLCFSCISETSPITIIIEGRQVRFTSAKFEFDEGLVGIDQDGNSHYSNIDVMLVSDEGDIVLLLESKFTEYLSWGKQTGISDVVYGRYYDEIKPVLDEMGLTYSHQVDKEGCKVRGYMNLEAIKGATQVYAPGLKQMMSHTLGASSYAKVKQSSKIYLASILYRFPSELDCGKLDNYVEAYRIWVKGLNRLSCKPSNLTVLDEPFYYQDVFVDSNAQFLPNRVKQYYGFI